MATAVRRRRTDEDTKRAPGADRYRDEPDEDDDDLDDDEEESPRAKRRKEREEEPRGRSRRSRDDDEDEDEKPRSRRRGRDEDDEDDDDDEPPARSRRRGRDDEEDDEDEPEEKPRRSRRAARDDDLDDDEDEKPRRGRSRRGRDDDDEEDDDDEPRGRGGKSSAGWDQWNKKRQAMGSFANELRLPDDESQMLIKFLDDEPFATWGVHWLTMPRGRRPYVCLGEGCPLCDKLGDSPKAMAAFNVLVLNEDADPKLMVWAASPEPTRKIEAKAKARTGPLTKHYYAVSKTKKGSKKNGPPDFNVDVVRERDLREEWGIKPLSEAVLEKYESKMYDEAKYLKRATKQELRAAAREAQDDDD